MKPSELPEGIAKFFPDKAIGGDREVLKAVIEGITKEIREIKRILENIEVRMVGASLLIIWEGDEAALRACLVNDDGDEEDKKMSSGEDAVSGSDDEDDAGPLAFTVKLIDFAHTRLAPGRGPDPSVGLGLENVLKLLEGRIAQLSAAAKTE